MRGAIQRQISLRDGGFRVIPVLLPGLPQDMSRIQLPTFLVASAWVDFRKDINDSEALRRLICGIRNIRPEPNESRAIASNSRLEVLIRIKCNPDKFQELTHAAERFLREVSGDSTLTVKFTRPGSVIIGVECSISAFEHLRTLITTGQLATLLGFKILDISIAEEQQVYAESPKVLNRKGYSLAQAGRLVEAIGAFLQATKLDPEYYDAYNNLGIAYALAENFSEAFESWSKAIGLDPANARAFYNRGTAYLQLGQYRQAILDLDAAIARHPVIPDARHNLQIAASKGGERKKLLDSVG